MGAMIGLRLTKQISLVLEIPIQEATFWLDNMNVTYWIHGQSRNYKPLVSHRVGEIHEYSSPNRWLYVPNKHNPADHGTRRLTVSELADGDMWWIGPQFLLFPESDWPERRSCQPAEALTEVKSERRQSLKEQFESSVEETAIRTLAQNSSTFAIIDKQDWRLDSTGFSKWCRVSSNGLLELGRSLLRVRSWVKRFIKNCRVPSERRIKGELKANELEDTELEIIRETQKEEYNEEIAALTALRELYKRSPLLRLTPMHVGRRYSARQQKTSSLRRPHERNQVSRHAYYH